MRRVYGFVDAEQKIKTIIDMFGLPLGKTLTVLKAKNFIKPNILTLKNKSFIEKRK